MGIKIKRRKPVREVCEGEPPVGEDEQLKRLREKVKDAENRRKRRQKGELKPHEKMKMIHAEWIKHIGVACPSIYKCTIQDDIDRVDIQEEGKNFRICMVGLIDNTLDANVFFQGVPDRMEPGISFTNVPTRNAVTILNTLLELVDRFYQEFTRKD